MIFLPAMHSRRRPILVASVLALVLIAAAVGHGAAGAPAPERWIVFSAHPNGCGGTAAAHPRSGQRHGAPSDHHRCEVGDRAGFSPDGKQIVFARLGSGIFRMNPDGSGLRRLTSGGRDIYPVWSPDGTRIAFLRPFKTGWRLFVMSPTGAGQRRLPQAPPAGRPSWTRNGKSILIPSAADLVQVDAQTGRIQKYFGLTLDIQTTQNATVSPNDLMVAYLGPRLSTGPEDCGEGPCPQYALYLRASRRPTGRGGSSTTPAPPAGRRTGRRWPSCTSTT